MNIGILGPGAVGSFLGSCFNSKNNNIFCFGRKRSSQFIMQNGIEIKSNFYGNNKFFPKIKLSKNENLDYLFITVKAFDLDAALKEYSKVSSNKTIVISLLNGLGYTEILKKNFNNKIVMGTIGYLEVFIDKNRKVIHKSNKKAHIEIASDNNKFIYELKGLKNLINDAHINCEIINNEKNLTWRKLIRLCTISTITSLANSNLGKARSTEPYKSIMKDLVRELCLIAAAENIYFNEAEIIDNIYSLPEDLRTSMQRDINSNKPSELNFILKEPIKLGNSLNLKSPILQSCYDSLKALQTNFIN